MPTYYVGPGGNNANSGLSWAQRKLTLNGAEDIPVAAGDTVYVGPGVYRETLTVDVSGAAGSPITYIGDYTGANTSGVGGVVRITGSDDDITITRLYCITTSGTFDYRTFTGFSLDLASNVSLYMLNARNSWIVENCFFQLSNRHITLVGVAQNGHTIRRCHFGFTTNGQYQVQIGHSSALNDRAHSIENCIFYANPVENIQIFRVGGITIKNNLFVGSIGIRVAGALTAGQTETVNNCIFIGHTTGLQATVVGEITEDYNTLYLVATPRTNVAAGLNSNTYPPLLDIRWFFEAVNGGRLVTPFDLGQWSQLVNYNSGLNPPATDLRGTGQIGLAREWGPLEYDPTLEIAGGGGAGAVSISPYRGNL